MTGTSSMNPVFSGLTLALLEDSGWYHVNYSASDPLVWGRGQGCSFAQQSCAGWNSDLGYILSLFLLVMLLMICEGIIVRARLRYHNVRLIFKRKLDAILKLTLLLILILPLLSFNSIHSSFIIVIIIIIILK